MSLFSFYERERLGATYKLADKFDFIPTVGSDLLSSPPVRASHLSQRHVFLFSPRSLSVMETKFGSRTYPVIASLLMKLALRAAAVFYGHLTARHNTAFSLQAYWKTKAAE